MFGYYSVEQAKISGSVEWSTPDGGVIRVTQVDNSSDYQNTSNWKDMICLGEVVDFVGNHEGPTDICAQAFDLMLSLCDDSYDDSYEDYED